MRRSRDLVWPQRQRNETPAGAPGHDGLRLRCAKPVCQPAERRELIGQQVAFLVAADEHLEHDAVLDVEEQHRRLRPAEKRALDKADRGSLAADGQPRETISDDMLRRVFGVVGTVNRIPARGSPFVLPHEARRIACREI